MSTEDRSVVDIISLLIKGCKNGLVLSSDKLTLGNCRYLLNQVIRQIWIQIDKYYVSAQAKQLWEQMTNDDILRYTYTDKVTISNHDFHQNVGFFRGGEKNSYQIKELQTGNSFGFREVFHDEHIIPINVIIKELLSIEPTRENIESVIGQIKICKMLKEEDRKISERVSRPRDADYVINSIYGKYGIEIISANEYKEKHMEKYKKCPICELNYIKIDESCCDVCKEQELQKKNCCGDIVKRKPGLTNNNTHFIIKNDRSINGYKLYDINNGKERLIGEIIPDPQRSKDSYLQAVMHFTLCNYDEYGEWHLVRKNATRLLFQKVEDDIRTKVRIEIDIDKW